MKIRVLPIVDLSPCSKCGGRPEIWQGVCLETTTYTIRCPRCGNRTYPINVNWPYMFYKGQADKVFTPHEAQEELTELWNAEKKQEVSR